MILKIKHFVIFITFLCFFSCKKKSFVITSIKGKQIELQDSVQSIDSINDFVTPYRNRINQILDSTLAYAPKTISKEDGKYNTSEGNLMADIIMSEANPIFKSRTGNEIDFTLLNYGGIRSVISKGNVSARTAYQVMPFENSIVVAELTGKSVRQLVYYLVNSDVPHPISGLQVILDKKNKLQSVNIKGEPFNEDRNYFVATSSYLLTGGDKMSFFKDNVGVTEVDYMIRNAMIDYFKKVDTIAPFIDDRFIKL